MKLVNDARIRVIMNIRQGRDTEKEMMEKVFIRTEGSADFDVKKIYRSS